MPKILAQGAEAIIRLEGNKVVKDRISKFYRLKVLDEKIIKQRTRSELRLLERASKIINIPKIISSGENKIVMEFINGKRLSSSLDEFSLKEQKTILSLISKDIAKLHKADIIHGDLTTSNMILVDSPDKMLNKTDKNVNNKCWTKKNSQKNSALTINNKSSEPSNLTLAKSVSNNQSQVMSKSEPTLGWGDGNSSNFKIVFIDFGLGFISNKLEDKAVDIHLLKQALEAKHFVRWQELWKEFEKSYKSNPESKKVLERLKAVEKRGRYKEKY